MPYCDDCNYAASKGEPVFADCPNCAATHSSVQADAAPNEYMRGIHACVAEFQKAATEFQLKEHGGHLSTEATTVLDEFEVFAITRMARAADAAPTPDPVTTYPTVIESIQLLEAAGFGAVGKPNTLLAMVKEAIAASDAAPKGTEEELTISDYEDVLNGYRRLVRELDVIWNGEEGAAKQASLCDMVAQIENELPKLRADKDRNENIMRLMQHFIVRVEPFYERKHGKLPPEQSRAWELLAFVQNELERAAATQPAQRSTADARAAATQWLRDEEAYRILPPTMLQAKINVLTEIIMEHCAATRPATEAKCEKCGHRGYMDKGILKGCADGGFTCGCRCVFAPATEAARGRIAEIVGRFYDDEYTASQQGLIDALTVEFAPATTANNALDQRDDLIRHMAAHSNFSKNGYHKMGDKQRALFNLVTADEQ